MIAKAVRITCWDDIAVVRFSRNIINGLFVEKAFRFAKPDVETLLLELGGPKYVSPRAFGSGPGTAHVPVVVVAQLCPRVGKRAEATTGLS